MRTEWEMARAGGAVHGRAIGRMEGGGVEGRMEERGLSRAFMYDSGGVAEATKGVLALEPSVLAL